MPYIGFMSEIRPYVPPQSSVEQIVDRYDALLAEHPVRCEPDPGKAPWHLRWMLAEIRKGEMDAIKLHRWLGFVQGMLTSMDLIRVPVERDLTRPLLSPNA